MPVRVDAHGYYGTPGQLRPENAVDAVLNASLEAPASVLTQRPPVPQQVFPARHGYRQTPLTIDDVLATDRWATKRRAWLSGAPAMAEPEGTVEGSAGLRNYNSQGLM